MPGLTGSLLDLKVRRLRRAAVFDIFDQLGLEVVPGHVWGFTDEADDIADGISVFFDRIGVEPKALRARDETARARANTVLDLLVEVGDAFQHLRPDVKARIEARLSSGDYDLVRETARTVAIFQRIHRQGDIWPEDRRIGLFNVFLDSVAEALEDPLSIAADDVEAAAASSGELQDLMLRFDAARSRYAVLYNALIDLWPEAWDTGPERIQFDEQTSLFDSLTETLQTTRDTTIDAVSESLGVLEEVLHQLEAIHAEAMRAAGPGGATGGSHGGGSGKSGSAGGKSDPGSIKDRKWALEVLGLSIDSDPTEAMVTKAFRAYQRLHHPDMGEQTKEERERREALSVLGNQARDILRKGYRV
uniref:J domain-containing protein n=1 Tax=uncultured Caulobacter sp. TaxID=158749 RepID=UPI0025FFF42D|nr:J domain-containing protein [uncultured Caulobacter sp.]